MSDVELAAASTRHDLDDGAGVGADQQGGSVVPTKWIVLSKHRLVYAPLVASVHPSTRRERSVPESWTDPYIVLNNGEHVWCTALDIALVKEATRL